MLSFLFVDKRELFATKLSLTTVIAETILLILSILFSRVTVNVLVFVLRVVFYVTRYMCDARRQHFALLASFVSEVECFDGSEVTRKGNDSIVQRQNCVVEEVKEVEFRSRHAWEIYLLQNLQFRWVN